MYSSRNRIFSGKGSIREYLVPIVKSIDSEIESTSENYILTVSEEQYSEYLIDKYSVELPEIHFSEVYADSYEKEISSEDYPSRFDAYRGEKYKRPVIQFFVPVSGNSEVLKYFPGINSITIGGRSTDFEVENSNLKLEVIDFYNDPIKVKQIFDENVNNSHRKFNDLLSDIKMFNSSLNSHITEKIRERKAKFLQKNEFMSSLGVPLKKKFDTSQTFSVPKPNLRTKISIVKPSVSNEAFKPEPTLNNEIYNQILKLINDIGKNFERLPSIYKDKGEEDLRDHIIMTLDPNFEYGSVTGETFNKTGKTDIQLRYDSSVIFIAECKFWTGEKGYLKTISQLLNYLTWRDTKASVIIFVRQKEFSSILEKVKEVTSLHDNYLGFVSKSDENWFNYRFHLNGDKNREVKLAIQLFHLP
ncbi:hypothetical protein LZZ90_09920 [Flavobacterium sp. SM15]|uniref:hypothetical protein n=1 Tax=Flavobacterium sp. SM15 TaxID=2908005 RepID=UPI001EDA4F33|nr:hypothetical protein [Flavobacterium sp. SM15]MCG2611820.1 hypothetical protein [Flavobacterium sp. SM15]